ncbi:MAG: hypothetical protein CMB80_31100 [Flammeovirgaceae bacterium]|nr:hypothetical protein [Flammeovirgaceae bacterium]|tara:strand:- start:17 stop:208 length:192 start_codon:yes stop_codon:yes gene_type:complete
MKISTEERERIIAFLVILNELPIWGYMLSLTVLIIGVVMFALKAVVVGVAIMLFLMITAKAGE